MKKHLSNLSRGLTISSLLILLVVIYPLAQSQSQHSLAGNVPFEFSVGNKVMPAGNYRFISSRNTSGFMVMTISNSAGEKTSVPILTKLGGGFDPSDAKLVFDNVDSKKILAEVWIPGDDGLLIQSTSKEHSHQVVLVTVSGPSSSKMAGNKIYEQTCQKCHGPNGQGNPAADKFFQAAIPKLNEVAAGKTDQELQDIISHGRRNMPPVRIGQATVQHLLPPESVDAVIAFIRTFKK
jgi:cytochrome c5